MAHNSAELWDIATGKEIRQFEHEWVVQAVAFSPDGRWIVTGGSNTAILWDANLGTEVRRFAPSATTIAAVAFSPDGRFVIIGDLNRSARLMNVSDGTIVRELSGSTGAMQRLAFSKDGTSIMSGGLDGIAETWDIGTGAVLRRFIGHRYVVNSVALSPDGRLALTGSGDGTARFWNVRNGDWLATINPFRGADWGIVTPEGRFDTNQVDGIAPLHWIVDDQPLVPIPLEIFMRDYYEPRLLPRLLACHDAEARGGDRDACEKTFRPVRPLGELNRIQPDVRIVGVHRGATADEAVVDVEVAGKEDTTQKNGKTKTGVYDVRLFRDGQIVGQWPEPRGGIGGAEDIVAWRSETQVPISAGQTKGTHQFRVKLAGRDKGQPVRFTAYAFNEDRVKSETATDGIGYRVPDDVIPAKPHAYVITIGVNGYQNPNWKLGFAVKDAEDLSAGLKQIEGYEVVPVKLVSPEYGSKLDQATKANIRDVITLLGGTGDARRAGLKDRIGPIVDQLHKVTPDDLVILAFSGHGHTDQQGRFYLLPSNSGLDSTITYARLPRFISSEELSQWLREVDAGELVMIIDACHSAASVPESFKPGPMGDRGLGQLAYDKGMQILAATQADNVALESEKLGQGLLTYALVKEGLKDRRAAPGGNGQVTIKSWLRYAEKRVPELYEDVRAGRLRVVGFDAADAERQLIAKDLTANPAFYIQTAQHAQTSALFDFYKLNYDPILPTR